MSLETPSKEDIVKLHAEINQLINQRFTLNTLALTMFGVMSALIMPKSIGSIEAMRASFVSATMLVIFLGLLYFLSSLIYNMFRTFTVYLRMTKASNWEKDWHKYRKHNKRAAGYSTAYKVYFSALGLLSGLIPFYQYIKYDLTWPTFEGYSFITVLFLYFMIVISPIFTLRERDMEKKWKSVSRNN